MNDNIIKNTCHNESNIMTSAQAKSKAMSHMQERIACLQLMKTMKEDTDGKK